MKVIKVLEKVDKDNVKEIIMSTFDSEGNSIEVTADKINWCKFKKWIRMKMKIKRIKRDSLETRIELLNKLLEIGKIIYVGEPFEI